ncbi:hypothetical protein EKD51_12325, partial [Salmonella enterica]
DFLVPFWPRAWPPKTGFGFSTPLAAARRASVASQTSRTTCTLRFLRAVRVQTGCANNAWWDRLLIFYFKIK